MWVFRVRIHIGRVSAAPPCIGAYALAGIRLHLFCVMGKHRTRAQKSKRLIDGPDLSLGLKAGAHVRDVICSKYNIIIRTQQGECASARRRCCVSAVPRGEWGRASPRGATGRHMRRSPAPCCAASGIAVRAGGVRCDADQERGRRLRVARGALVRYIGLNARTCVHACVHAFVHACMRACVHACARASYRRRDSQKLTLGQRRCC